MLPYYTTSGVTTPLQHVVIVISPYTGYTVFVNGVRGSPAVGMQPPVTKNPTVTSRDDQNDCNRGASAKKALLFPSPHSLHPSFLLRVRQVRYCGRLTSRFFH